MINVISQSDLILLIVNFTQNLKNHRFNHIDDFFAFVKQEMTYVRNLMKLTLLCY